MTDIPEVKPTTTAEQKNASLSKDPQKVESDIPDEEIHIKDLEEQYHNEAEYDTADEEFEIDW